VDQVIEAIALGLDDHARRCLDLIGDGPVVSNHLPLRKIWQGRDWLCVFLNKDLDLCVKNMDLVIRPI
jgi:hypothetical protein